MSRSPLPSPALAAGYRLLWAAFALVVTWWLFRHVATLLLAALLATILALPLAAVADRLERWRIPRTLAVAAQVVALIAVVAALVVWLAPTAIGEARLFINALPSILADVRTWLQNTFGVEPKVLGEPIRDFLLGVLDSPARIVSAGLTGVQLFGGVLLVAISAVYMAVSPKPLVRGFVLLFAPRHAARVETVLARIRGRWLGWLQGLLVDMLATGVLTYFGLMLIGLEFAIVFAVITGLLEIIPYLGPFLAAIPPVLYALTISPETALLTLGVYVAIQQLEGHLLLPLVMAKAVDLHPVLVAFGVVILGSLFGFLGVLVAVPLISAIVILVDELRVKPLHAGEPPSDNGRAAVTAQARHQPVRS